MLWGVFTSPIKDRHLTSNFSDLTLMQSVNESYLENSEKSVSNRFWMKCVISEQSQC